MKETFFLIKSTDTNCWSRLFELKFSKITVMKSKPYHSLNAVVNDPF